MKKNINKVYNLTTIVDVLMYYGGLNRDDEVVVYNYYNNDKTTISEFDRKMPFERNDAFYINGETPLGRCTMILTMDLVFVGAYQIENKDNKYNRRFVFIDPDPYGNGSNGYFRMVDSED